MAGSIVVGRQELGDVIVGLLSDEGVDALGRRRGVGEVELLQHGAVVRADRVEVVGSERRSPAARNAPFATFM